MIEFCTDMQTVPPKAVPACVGTVWVEQESWTLTRLACVQAVAKQGLRTGAVQVNSVRRLLWCCRVASGRETTNSFPKEIFEFLNV